MNRKILFSYCLLYVSMLCLSQKILSQNVGIGTTTPVRAKLEVNGGVGSTAAIFGGESTGISLQRNYPGIGFNQYWDGSSRYMSNGYSAMQYLDPTNGQIYMNLFPFGLANTSAASQVRSYTIAATGNISIRSSAITNASLYVDKAGNADGSAFFGGSQFGTYFHNGFNEDTYIRGGKTVSSVIINDVSAGPTVIGGGPTSTAEIRGSLFGYPASPLAPAMNLVPLGVVHYSGTLNNITSGSFSTNFQNLTGSFVNNSSGEYQNSSTVADYMRITLTLDATIFNQYTEVIGINSLNFNGDAGISGGNGLITRLFSGVSISGASRFYLIEVGVDDFGNAGPAEVATMSGNVIFYGIR
jgi:hypothetical protein